MEMFLPQPNTLNRAIVTRPDVDGVFARSNILSSKANRLNTTLEMAFVSSKGLFL